MHETEFLIVKKQVEKCTKENFADQFAILVRDSKLSQKELAQALGIAESAVVNYKRGRIPSAGALLRIAVYFGVSMEWLMLGQGYRTTEDAVDAVMAHQDKMDPDLSDPVHRKGIEAAMRKEVKERDNSFLATSLEARLTSSERKLSKVKEALQRLLDEI